MLDMQVATPMFVATPKWDAFRNDMHKFNPKSEMGKIVKRCFRYLPPDLAHEMLDTISRCIILESQLEWTVRYLPDSPFRHGGPLVEHRGIVSRKKVTTAGVTALCVAWANATFDAKYMSLGTATTAENKNQVGMTTEIIASHYAGGVRPTCTHVESANTVPLVGVHTQTTDTDTIEEHGITTSATQGAVTLWDRSLTGTTALAVGDGITATYTLTAQDEA